MKQREQYRAEIFTEEEDQSKQRNNTDANIEELMSQTGLNDKEFPLKKVTSREKRAQMGVDPIKPPPLGRYNPKLNKYSNKTWRNYSLEMKAKRRKERNRQKIEYKQMMRSAKASMRAGSRSKRDSFVSGFLGGKQSRFGMSSHHHKKKPSFGRDIDLLNVNSEKEHRRPSTASHSVSRSNSAVFVRPKKKRNLGKKKNYFGRFPNRPVSAYIHMAKRPERMPLNSNEIFDPDGKQFEYLDIPEVNSRAKPPKGFNIKKMQPRPPLFGDIDKDHPDYHPQFEFVKKQVSSILLNFETMTARKPPGKPSLTPNEDLYDYDRYKDSNSSMLIRKVRLVDMERNLPKELDPECGLPSFLQRKRPVTANAKIFFGEKPDRAPKGSFRGIERGKSQAALKKGVVSGRKKRISSHR